MGPSIGPQILLIKWFNTFWPTVVVADYKPEVDIPVIAVALSVFADIVEFDFDNQIRLTYQLFDLSLLYLRRVPPHGISLRKPDAIRCDTS